MRQKTKTTAEVDRNGTAMTLGPTLDFMRLLWELDHALQRRSKRMSRELGLTGPQRFVLRIVARFPRIPAGELAALLAVHPSTLTGILKRLESAGWVRRGTDPRDGRRMLLALTSRGRAIDAQTPQSIEGALLAVGKRLPSSDFEAARRVLTELARELESRDDAAI